MPYKVPTHPFDINDNSTYPVLTKNRQREYLGFGGHSFQN